MGDHRRKNNMTVIGDDGAAFVDLALYRFDAFELRNGERIDRELPDELIAKPAEKDFGALSFPYKTTKMETYEVHLIRASFNEGVTLDFAPMSHLAVGRMGYADEEFHTFHTKDIATSKILCSGKMPDAEEGVLRVELGMGAFVESTGQLMGIYSRNLDWYLGEHSCQSTEGNIFVNLARPAVMEWIRHSVGIPSDE
jgi:hypothetical protein